jgi:hypothetical protein
MVLLDNNLPAVDMHRLNQFKKLQHFEQVLGTLLYKQRKIGTHKAANLYVQSFNPTDTQKESVINNPLGGAKLS